MRYCPYCKRLNLGRPLYCRYCARTFDVRICSKCGHINPKEALACGKCGSFELSDTAGETPFWLILLKILFWSFVLFLIVVFVTNMASFVPLFVVIGLIVFGYSFLPEEVKKIIKFILNQIKQRVWGVKKKN